MDKNNNQNIQTNEVQNEVKSFYQKYNLKIIISVIVVLVLTFFIYSNYLSIEARAKICVNNYLNAIKNGEDTSDYKEYGVDDFINVLDYKFVSIKSFDKEKEVLELNRSDYNQYLSKSTNETYDEYVLKMKNVFLNKGEIISETNNSFSIFTGKYYDKIILLYDVNLTNALGNSLYKKVYFTVTNEDDNFKIIDINY
ncbi:hypothetical protein [Sporotomaculum syntrophicum]|nr:hypothetical protein [Sporotomaculum syntrophicum]